MHFYTAALFALFPSVLSVPEPKWKHFAGGTAVGLGAGALLSQQNQIDSLQQQVAAGGFASGPVRAQNVAPIGTVAVSGPMAAGCAAPIVVVNGIPMQTQLINGVPTLQLTE